MLAYHSRLTMRLKTAGIWAPSSISPASSPKAKPWRTRGACCGRPWKTWRRGTWRTAKRFPSPIHDRGIQRRR